MATESEFARRALLRRLSSELYTFEQFSPEDTNRRQIHRDLVACMASRLIDEESQVEPARPALRLAS
jgi:hypothetical protein